MLRIRPEQLKLGIGGARGMDEQLAAKREGIVLVSDTQALKLEGGVNGHEDVVALGPQRSRGWDALTSRPPNPVFIKLHFEFELADHP
jgi:hypothetical protein